MKIHFTVYHQFLAKHFGLVGQQLQGQVIAPAGAVSRSSLGSQPVSTLPLLNISVKTRKTRRTKSVWPKAKTWVLNLVIGMAILVAAALVLPDIYYSLVPADTQPIKTAEAGTPLGGNFATGSTASLSANLKQLPPQDMSLPDGDWVIIPKIGVRTKLQATENPDDALKTGVWMVPDYGRPGDTDKPMILAAHRFGWKWWWKDDYWKYNSFYLLPKLEPGDIVETISDHRKYYYEIYAGEEGEEITDYTADLIMYTCKFLNSPLRHFRYARLVDMTKNSQTSATPGVPVASPAGQVQKQVLPDVQLQ